MHPRAQDAWETLTNNFLGWLGAQDSELRREHSPVFRIFTKLVLQAWAAREAAFRHRQTTDPMTPPLIVSQVKETLAQISGLKRSDSLGVDVDINFDDFQMDMPMDFADQSMLFNMDNQDACIDPNMYFDTPGQAVPGANMQQMDWGAIGGLPGWNGNR